MNRITFFCAPVILLSAAVAIILWASVSFAGDIAADLQARLDQAGSDEPIPVIIHLQKKVDRGAFKQNHKSFRRGPKRASLIRMLKGNADRAQGGLIGMLKSRKSRNIRSLWIINGIAATLPAKEISPIAELPFVQRIETDRVVPLAVGQGAGASAPEWNITAIRADELWNMGYSGQGVVVAVMDSGADLNHPDLAAAYRGGANSWFDPNGEYAQPADNSGHGTGVLSVMVGGDAGGSVIGVAPDAQWIAVKIFNSLGVAPLSAIHAGFQWLLDPDSNPDTDDAPDIVNNSWGFDLNPGSCDPEFSEDIALLKAADMAVVFSAGNTGPWDGTSVAPGNDPQSTAVGAVDSTLTVAGFSARGPSACNGDIYPNLTAPGVSIKTADLTFGGLFPDSYFYSSGTSFAAPHVAGAMALLLSAFPDLTPAEVEDALVVSAVDLGPAGPDDTYGNGVVDVLGAFNYLTGGVCTDGDGDGFFAQAGCGTEPDCRDDDMAIFPGAPEVARDGIDQDCNGYDLTIAITRAIYDALTDDIVVYATSDLGSAAELTVDIPGIGVKPMVWKAVQNRWARGIRYASQKGFDPQNPGNVTVAGIEGIISRSVQVQGAMPAAAAGSIVITYAVYDPSADTIVVHATSDLGPDAELVMGIANLGFRDMIWNAANGQWQRGIGEVTAKGFDPLNPGSVVVSGVEGQTSRGLDIAG